MANVKISELPAASAASASQEFETNDSGTSRKVTGSQLKSFVKSGLAVADVTDLTATADELNVLDGITGMASQAVAEAGTDNATLMTPLRVAQAIDAQAAGLTANVQEFTSSGTWTKPAGAKFVVLELWGAGGGGGSGRRGATSTERAGGAGGGGSPGFIRTYRESELSATVSVTIGAGGSGGAAQTVDTTNGNAGTAGGNSSFGSYATSVGGGGGSGGSTFTAAGASGGQAAGAGITLLIGGAGGSSIVAAGGAGGKEGDNGVLGMYTGLGGGGGGVISAANATFNAGIGGAYYSVFTQEVTATGVGSGVTGAAGASFGVGGGGGGFGVTVNAGAGGAGNKAAGGGGGGASLNGFKSGAGGAGGNGFCRVTTYY